MRLRGTNPIHWVAGGLIALAYAMRLPLLAARFFDPDEFQHTHSAWYISMGYVPYRDYVDHHTPLFHYILAPFFSFHDAAASAADGEAMLFLARKVVWVLAGLIIVLAFELARRWRGTTVAFSSTLLLSLTMMFLDKTLEIRPDLLTVIFWLGALIFTLSGTRSDGSRPGRDLATFTASGASLALGIFSSQKLLFAGPGFVATMIWFLANSRSALAFRRRAQLVAAQLAGFAIVIALGLAFFASQHALTAFIHYNLTANIGLGTRFSPVTRIRILLRQNPFFMALGVVGFLFTARTMFRAEAARRGDQVILLNLVGLFIGLFLNPVPYEQSFLTLLPLVAMVAAVYLVEGTTLLYSYRPNATSAPDLRLAALYAAATIVLVFLGIRQSAPLMAHFGMLVPVTGLIALAAYAIFFTRHAPEYGVAAMLAFLAVFPLAQMRLELRATNERQLAAIRAVYAESSPTDTFLDGFTGFGVFRPHASRFWFLHREMQAMMTTGERQEVVTQLVSGAITPRLIGFDRSLQSLSPALTQYVVAHYEPIGIGTLYRRIGPQQAPAASVNSPARR